MKILDRLAVGLTCVDRSMFQLCGLFMLVMMVVGAADVILNNTIGYGVPATIDISQAMFVLSVFLALPIVVRRGAHIRVDLFLSMFPNRMKKVANAVSAVLSALVYLTLAYAMWDLFRASWRVNEQSLSVVTFPIYPIKFLAFIGLALAAVIGFSQIVGLLRNRI